MEFIHLFNLAALLVFCCVKLFRAWTEHDNIQLKREQIQYTTAADLLFYSDGKQIKSIER